ncbi:MAG: DUF4097 family beta strand repeat protein [Clostridia bacterium]|nr:DUF4097 family beta strand repeat protein [Clostridia bacterium]
MKGTTKICLIIAAALILTGCVIFGGVMTALKWDFLELSTSKYETNSYVINESFKDIRIVTDTADVELVPSEAAESSVTCYGQKGLNHSVKVKDGALVIELEDTRKWYEHIGINFGSPKITVYIPKGQYGAFSLKATTGDVLLPKDFSFACIDISENTGDVTSYASASADVKIKTTTGDICIENVSAGSIELSVSTGDVKASGVACGGDFKVTVSSGTAVITDVACGSFISDGDTGDITMNSVIATGKLDIERDTGDVKLDGCDASEIFIETDTGDVEGTLLTDKVFITETDTGSVRVPSSVTGGRCEITTDTGDIIIKIAEKK